MATFSLRTPDETLTQLTEAVGCAKSTAHDHLRALQAVGIVEARRAGLTLRYFLDRSERNVASSDAYSDSSSIGVSR